MKICIIHFANSLLRIFLANIFFQEFLYGVLLVLCRCCFRHLVENSILYKKDIQHFCIGPILFSEIKSYGRWSAEKLTVKFLFGARSEKPNILFWCQGWEMEKFIWYQMTVTNKFIWQSMGKRTRPIVPLKIIRCLTQLASCCILWAEYSLVASCNSSDCGMAGSELSNSWLWLVRLF